jgi:hypothetical protein
MQAERVQETELQPHSWNMVPTRHVGRENLEYLTKLKKVVQTEENNKGATLYELKNLDSIQNYIQ